MLLVQPQLQIGIRPEGTPHERMQEQAANPTKEG